MDYYNSASSRKKAQTEKLLIKGGTVVNHDHSFTSDVYIENGIIRQVTTDNVFPGGVTTIDASGCLVLPGGIDVATFFEAKPTSLEKRGSDEMISVDNFYSGSKAAIIGGTTTIMDFVNCERGNLANELQNRLELAEKCSCNLTFHGDVTMWNEKVANDMTSLANDRGINSFRVFMSDKGQLTDTEIYEVFQHIRELGCIAIVHAENGDLIRKNLEELKANGHNGPESIMYARNEDVECEAVQRAIAIARQVSCPVFFWNVTSKDAIDAINDAKAKGFPVYGQTLAVGLAQDGSAYKEGSWEKAAAHLTFPPLRDDPNAKENLITALSSGSLSCIASGHATFNASQKATYGKDDCEFIPPGTNGVYERMMALWASTVDCGMLTENEFVACTSTNAAKLFNMYPKKGHIAVGSDADVVVWDPQARRNLASSASSLKVHNTDAPNAFEGMESSGSPKYVICKGRLCVNTDQMHIVQGWGEILSRETRPAAIYQRLEARDRVAKSKRAPVVRQGVPSLVDVSSVNGTINTPELETGNSSPRFSRGSGHRSMHQSGWSFSGDQVGDHGQRKTGHKILGPPGGRSNILSLG